MAKGPKSSILVTIRITVRMQESEVRNPHSLDYRKSYNFTSTDFDEILWKARVWPRDPTDYILVSICKLNPFYCQNPLLAISAPLPQLRLERHLVQKMF